MTFILTLYTLYCVCIMTTKHNRGVADEADAIGEQLGVAMQD